jgi:predicted dehydrogenase
MTALTAHERVEIEDVAVAVVRFASGALATFHATTAAFPGLAVRLQVHGSRGSAIIHDDELEYFAAAGPDDDDSGTGIVNQVAELVPSATEHGNDPVPAGFAEGHLRQYVDLVDAIRTGRAPGVTVDDAIEALAVVRAIYASATLGRPVLFDDVLSGRFDELEVRTGGDLR